MPDRPQPESNYSADNQRRDIGKTEGQGFIRLGKTAPVQETYQREQKNRDYQPACFTKSGVRSQ
jgi:hypothetical protein